MLLVHLRNPCKTDVEKNKVISDEKGLNTPLRISFCYYRAEFTNGDRVDSREID